MAALIQNITATILIQVGADEPKPIGTIVIPIEISTGSGLLAGGALAYPPGVRSAKD